MVGDSDLGFTFAHVLGSSKSRRGAYGHGVCDATSLDPLLIHSEVLSKVTNVCGEVPGGISSLPAFYIHLYQQESVMRENNSCLVCSPHIVPQLCSMQQWQQG